jgi:hypothetical protein
MTFFSSVLRIVAFARRTRRQMAHIAPGEKKPIARFIEKNIQSRVDELETARRIERNRQRMPKESAHDSTVRHHDYRFTNMFMR